MKLVVTFSWSLLFCLTSWAQDFDESRFVDLRDLAKWDANVRLTSQKVLDHMNQRPDRFAGPIEGDQIIPGVVNNVNFSLNGSTGNAQQARKTNTIFSAEFEQITQLSAKPAKYSAVMMLFIHDSNYEKMASSQGYYFRRLQVTIDWAKKLDVESFVHIDKVLNEIPMDQTQFEIRAAILDRKIIMEDKNFGITKVFPMTVGAIDIRKGTVDDVVESMTLMIPENIRDRHPGTPQYRNFSTAALVKRSVWPHVVNTRSRSKPSYYRGRPFLGIVDKNFVPESGDRYQAYRLIAFHYQIKKQLVRGFVSHGCMRVRDKDLYQMDVILNHGPHDELAVFVDYDFENYRHLDHPMPKVDNRYGQVIYRQGQSKRWVKCSPDSPSYRVRTYGPYHTVADSDCLTKVSYFNRDIQDILDYKFGRSSDIPTMLVQNINHHQKLAETPTTTVESPSATPRNEQPVIINPNRQRAISPRAKQAVQQGQGGLF